MSRRDAEPAAAGRRPLDRRRLARPRRASPSARRSPCWTIPTTSRRWSSGSARAPLVALDAETVSLEPHDAEIVGLSLAASPDRGLVSPVRPPARRRRARRARRRCGICRRSPTPAMAPLSRAARPIPSVPKAGHNIKYDWQVLRGGGRRARGVAYDSMLASFVLDPGRRSHAIDTLCLEHLGRAMQTYADVAGRGKAEIPFAEVAIAAAAEYCGTDSATVLALHEFFAPALREIAVEPLLRDDRDAAGRGAGGHGVGGHRDRPAAVRPAERGARPRTCAGWRSEIAAVAGRGAQPQLAPPARDRPVREAAAPGPQEDQDRALDRRRRAGAARGDGARAAAADPRVPRAAEAQEHLRGHAAGPDQPRTPAGSTPASTRPAPPPAGSARSEPNLQNIPVRTPRGEEIRRGFVPRAGLASSWWPTTPRSSCGSWRISPGDPAFIEAFRQGGDIHRQTAALIFGVPVEQVTPEMRARAKTINFATIYGQGPFALSRQLGIAQEDAQGLHRALLRALRRGARLPRPAGPARAGAGLRGDALQAAALHPGDQGPQLQHARLRRAQRAELAAPGLAPPT